MGIENPLAVEAGGFFLGSMAQFVPAKLVEAREAIVPIEVFNKCPHDRDPRLSIREARPALFQGCFVDPGNGFVQGPHTPRA
jgi:hypothetical protein